MRRAGMTAEMVNASCTRAEPNSAGFRVTEVPLRAIDDAGLARILARAPSDPHVDIVVMHRMSCGHCKPELSRVAAFEKTDPGASGWAAEIDQAQNIEALKELLLDEDWSSPATGYFRGGFLRLSSPDRRRSVADLAGEARGLPAAPRASVLGSDRIT